MLGRLGSFAFAVIILGSAGLASAQPQPPPAAVSLGPPGLANPDDAILSVAAPLTNLTGRPLLGVTIDRIRLGTAPVRTVLPLRIGAIAPRSGAVVQADFDSRSLRAGQRYTLTVQGAWRSGEAAAAARRFSVSATVTAPPPARGEARVGVVQAAPHKVEGGRYPHRQPTMDPDVNSGARPVPTNPFVAGAKTPTGTSLEPVRIGDPPAIRFDVNDAFGTTGAGIGCSKDAKAACAEPSGASGNGVILMSANWSVGYSTTGGAPFTILDPTTIFPADAVGFCCDQVIQYAPSIDRFIWLLQGTGYRLAVASPADIISGKGKAWTYWNLSPSLFGKCEAPDYPDLSIGDNSLYISWDAGGKAAGCTGGFQVVRTSLAGLKAGGTISLDFTDPANAPSSKIWGEHLTQNTGDEIFWAGHNGNTALTVYSLKEGSGTYVWRDTAISSWANNAPTAKTPDGQDWLAFNFNGPGGNSFPYNGVIGAARAGHLLWFGWTAGTDKNFKQAHIEIVTLDRDNNFAKTQQVQVWNDSYAFGYPSFASSACNGELAMSFEYGGGADYENHVVGFWGDYVAYITSNSNAGTDRFGDYVTIRRAPPTAKDNGNLFTAFGMGVNKKPAPSTVKTSDVRYVLFGRPTCHKG